MDAITTEPTEAHRKAAFDLIYGVPHGDGDESLRAAVETIAAALAEAEARGARTGPRGNQPPPDLVPEKLIDPDVLPALFDANYPALVKRKAELEGGVARWKALHLVPRPDDWPEGKAWPERYAVPNDADNNKCSDFMRMLAAYAGGKSAASGEVNEAREKVKKPLLAAAQSVDGWFNGLRDGLRRDMLSIDGAQRAYLEAKADEERRKRETEAAAAREEADRLAAQATASAGAEEAVAQALAAEARVETAERAAEAPVSDLTRTRSAAGTTTGLGGKWLWKLVDIKALARAVIAGDAPAIFLTTNDSVIGAAVRPKDGMRRCAGLEIYEEATVRRSGRTA